MVSDFKAKAAAIFQVIQESHKILLHLHPGPDGDSVGSALAMCHALRGLNKDVTVIKGDSDLSVGFEILPGFSEIVPQNFLETDLTSFDLFIALDSGSTNMISGLGEVNFPDSLKVVVIDHHESNTNYGQINLVDAEAPAAATIVYSLLKEWQIAITPDIAINLFVGLYTDTSGFRYSLKGGDIFRLAGELADWVPNFSQVLSSTENQNNPENLRFRGLAYSAIKTLANNQVAYIALSYDLLREQNIETRNTERSGLSNNLISVKAWLVGVSLVEKEPGRVSVSCRSQDGEKYDVSKLAGLFGGGGHKAAAGAMFKGSIAEAEKILQEGVKELYLTLST